MALVKFVNSVNSWNDGSGVTVGRTLSDVIDDVGQMLDLRGDETFQVASNGGTFATVNDGYVIRDGDEVRFSRSAGTKG